MKNYHEECCKKVDFTLSRIQDVLNRNKGYEEVSKEEKQKLKDIAASDKLYVNYLTHKLIDPTTIFSKEIIIYAEDMVKISESKNRCKMVETGYMYEKMPTWNESTLILDDAGTVIFTDCAVYLQVEGSVMRYPYKKIVNYGYEKSWLMQYAYFDVKTTSPFPHRFSFTDTFKSKEGEKEQNICLLLHSLI